MDVIAECSKTIGANLDSVEYSFVMGLNAIQICTNGFTTFSYYIHDNKNDKRNWIENFAKVYKRLKFDLSAK
jgi:hypothetical protein